MAQQYDPEAYRIIKQVSEELRDGAISKLPGALEVIKEQAEKNGLPVLVESTTNAAEVGAPAFVKCTNELLDAVDEYHHKAENFFNTFGIEY